MRPVGHFFVNALTSAVVTEQVPISPRLSGCHRFWETRACIGAFTPYDPGRVASESLDSRGRADVAAGSSAADGEAAPAHPPVAHCP